MDNKDFLPLIEDKSVDLMILDPPYKQEYHTRGKFWKERTYSKEIAEYGSDLNFTLTDSFLDEVCSKMKHINLIFFCDKNLKYDLQVWAKKNKYNYEEIPCIKTNPSPLTNNQWLPDREWILHVFVKCPVNGNYHTKAGYFWGKNYVDKGLNHPTPKPIHILERIILNCSKENDIVCDMFSGSGSTCVACIKTNRTFIGCERDEKYCAEANTRVNNFKKEKEMEI